MYRRSWKCHLQKYCIFWTPAPNPNKTKQQIFTAETSIFPRQKDRSINLRIMLVNPLSVSDPVRMKVHCNLICDRCVSDSYTVKTLSSGDVEDNHLVSLQWHTSRCSFSQQTRSQKRISWLLTQPGWHGGTHWGGVGRYNPASRPSHAPGRQRWWPERRPSVCCRWRPRRARSWPRSPSLWAPSSPCFHLQQPQRRPSRDRFGACAVAAAAALCGMLHISSLLFLFKFLSIHRFILL